MCFDASMTAAFETHRARLGDGAIYNGLWMMSTSAELATIGAATGFDYVCLDMQHGYIRPTDIVRLSDAIRAHGPALVTARVAANRFTEIGMLADAGIEAVIVPLIDSVADAEAAVRALDYPSRGGDRSWGATADILTGSVRDSRAERPLLFVMIETAEALASVEEICTVPGVDGIYVGPADLAFAVGAVPGRPNDAHAEALLRIRSAADAAGIVPGIHCADGAEAKLREEQGFRFITSASDIGAAARALRQDLDTARA